MENRLSNFILVFISVGLGGAGYLNMNQVFASASQSSLNLGVALFPQSKSSVLSQTGYLINFQIEKRDRWLRPTFGGQIDYASQTNQLVVGQMLGGIYAVAASADFIKPFLGVNALLGWASFSNSSSSYNSLIYGVLLSAGFELRFSKNNSASALRICTDWRYVTGNIGGGITGADLNAVQLTLGFTF